MVWRQNMIQNEDLIIEPERDKGKFKKPFPVTVGGSRGDPPLSELDMTEGLSPHSYRYPPSITARLPEPSPACHRHQGLNSPRILCSATDSARNPEPGEAGSWSAPSSRFFTCRPQ